MHVSGSSALTYVHLLFRISVQCPVVRHHLALCNGLLHPLLRDVFTPNACLQARAQTQADTDAQELPRLLHRMSDSF